MYLIMVEDRIFLNYIWIAAKTFRKAVLLPYKSLRELPLGTHVPRRVVAGIKSKSPGISLPTLSYPPPITSLLLFSFLPHSPAHDNAQESPDCNTES